MRWVVVLLLLSIGSVWLLRWVNPPGSAFMAWHWLEMQRVALFTPQDAALTPALNWRHDWVDLNAIAAPVAIAVIAAEDQRFPQHRGFDVVEMRQAWQRFQTGGKLRGASTISQQTAKNLFLWPGRDPVRKGLEAWFTVLIETLWPKERILEVYLNIAQFGPEIFGIGAASQHYFDRAAHQLTQHQASLLAAVLPNPNIYRIEAPSPQVKRRAAWIRRQMRQLGGVNYLYQLKKTVDHAPAADTFFLSITEQCSVTLNCQSADWGVSTKAAKTDVFTARTL
ncbi:monofunctional biosynthetic peptidoglycan transglycosylase [Thiospirillum jenense]